MNSPASYSTTSGTTPCPLALGHVQTPTTRLELNGRTVFVKHEYLNPSGSTKDRIARAMLLDALERNVLSIGGHVVEASSGSTALALALFSARLGVSFTAVMPEGVSKERIGMLKGYGAETILTPREEGVAGSIALAERISIDRAAFWPRQFENEVNGESHRRETAPELLADLPDGRCDAVVSGVGTGGTLVGLYRGCQDAGQEAIPVLARPVQAPGKLSVSPSFAEAECTGLSGGFSKNIPGVVDGMSCLLAACSMPGLVEIEVDDQKALAMTRQLIAQGLPVGPSSGLNVCAAVQIAERLGPEAVVATVLPDRFERYLSTGLLG